MSQKTDLQASNADLQAILNLVNSLPDKEEGSGVTCDACNIWFGNIWAYVTTYSYTRVKNGAISQRTVTLGDDSTVDYAAENDVVCGSILYARMRNCSERAYVRIIDGETEDDMPEDMILYNALDGDILDLVFITPSTAGVTVWIEVIGYET